MPETNESLLSLVNASGFLFQLRIEQEMKSVITQKGEGRIAAREHRWFDSQEGSERFIDLVVEAGFMHMVIECKRVIDANWVFLIPDKKDQISRARIKWTWRNTSSNKSISEWQDFNIRPLSPEAPFCIIRGQGEKDTPMLERISSLLLRSLESLANEELSYSGRSGEDKSLYIPIIITNANLHVCHFDPLKIDISTGQINGAEFEQVPCVRFRKNLSSTIPSAIPLKDLETSNRSNERTIFVINSDKMAETFGNWDVLYKHNAPWPWEGFH